MENSALNLAHQQSRRADAHLKAHRFEEATECHKRAAELLVEAMKDTKVEAALESLNFQRQHHLRQTTIIQLRKSQYEKYCRAVETNKVKNQLLAGGINIDFPVSDLPNAIFRAMEQTDSLLDQLLKPEDTVDAPAEAAVIKGSKQPKDDGVVLEELRTLNQHLHNFIVQLVSELDEKNKQNESLKGQVKSLTAQLQALQKNAAVGDNSGENEAETCLQESPDITPTTSKPSSSYHSVDRTLPILAPLEMPSFDYSVFQKLENKAAPPDLLQ